MPEHAEVCERFVPVLDAWSADRRPPLGLVHGDYRLDNLLFGDGTCRVVDWQTVELGPGDAGRSYFIGGGLAVEDRRAHEEDLVHLYYDELRELGVEGLSWDQCWEGYRRQAFHGILMAIAASMVVERTERGDDMFMAWLERNAQQVLDLDALALLPEPGAGRPAALRPEPADEGRHEPGPEDIWNESWYFDAVSDDGTSASTPASAACPTRASRSYTAADRRAGAAGGDGRARRRRAAAAGRRRRADDRRRRPARRASLRGAAPALSRRAARHRQAHEDESAPLRCETGAPVEVALDLVWETDGVPYAWRQTTRYEIPCRVSGTVRVGGEEIEFGGPGQRDHSWGARDWFAVDWMWSAFHLDDGTHTHAVGIPQMPGYGVGLRPAGGEMVEIESREHDRGGRRQRPDQPARESSPAPTSSSPRSSRWRSARCGWRHPTGASRTSRGRCAGCAPRDGRIGTGWIEWNRNQHGADGKAANPS